MLLSGCGRGQLGELIISESSNEIDMTISNIDTYNPLITKSESVSEMLGLIYEPLFQFDEKLMPQGVLAKDVIMSEDRLYAKITLAENVKWHSGAPFVGDDVVYTINEIKNGGTRYSDNVKEITSVSVAEDGSVLLSLSEPVMNIEGLLSFPVIRNGSAPELGGRMDGTGAFYVAEQSVRNILLLPTADKKSSASEVRVAVMRSDTACVNAFELGDSDFVTSAVVNLNEKTPSGDINIELYATNRMMFLGFNCQDGKYIEPSLRIAVLNIVNRKEIIEKAVFGKGAECRLPINPESGLYSPSEGLDINIEGVINKAGYTKHNGVYINASGEELSISILVNLENTEKLSAARLIAEQLKKQGINATVAECEFDEYTKRISEGNYDTFIGEMKMRDNLEPSFLTESANIFRYENAELQSVLWEMKMADGSEALKAKILDYERIFMLNPPMVPLYYRMEGVVFRKDVSGITKPNFYNKLKGIEKIYFKAKGGSDGQ